MESKTTTNNAKPKFITINAEHKRSISTQSTKDHYQRRAQTITIKAEHKSITLNEESKSITINVDHKRSLLMHREWWGEARAKRRVVRWLIQYD
ncbi:hypothetical protein [Absidia glauca]|uniref:Uncharacterized protein n=1 Tax=Absidia glauca TaxID=4829 RepID=A0A163JQK1_ABSGL|nr:hypothetical protein [Absidia glauca]